VLHAPPPPDDAEERRLDFERNLMEADRMMMQTVQTAMSLIGFGFTITTFFSDFAVRVGAPNGGRGATILGVSLLAIGLLLITGGTWTQARYRRELRRRYADVGSGGAAWAGLQARFTPSFITAVLLMGAGLFSLVSALIRWLL
jgi:putative membrane protein